MPGRKRKAVIDAKEVAAYQAKLRQPERPLLKLTNLERKKFNFKSPYQQEFPLSSNIIYYIARNPFSPKGHLKLISSCKFLARMSRILPVKCLEHRPFNKYGNPWKAEDLKKQYFRFWIYNELRILPETLFLNLTSTLIKHVHKVSLHEIVIDNQVLTFGELQFLVSGGQLENVNFEQTVVTDGDGSVTEFEKVFELLCCKKFIFACHPDQHGFGKNTANKMIQFLSSEQFPAEQYICLVKIPQIFDFKSFSNFLKANMTGRQHSINLEFYGVQISDAYKNELQNFVNELIQLRGIFGHTVPMIHFRGENHEAYEELWKMRARTC